MAEGELQAMCAAVLAASGLDRVARAYDVPTKAMVPIGGEPVVRRVIAALNGARLVREVTVVVGAGSLVGSMAGDIASVAEAAGPYILDSLDAALGAYPGEEQILLVTGDLPLLTSVAVDDFVSQALAYAAELTYSVVAKETMEASIPGAVRTYVPLGDGRVTGGNLFCISRQFARRERARIAQAFAARKNPLGLAKLMGIGFVLSFIVRRPRLEEVVRHAERLLNCRAHVVESSHPEVAFDIDKPVHVERAKEVLARLTMERSPQVQ